MRLCKFLTLATFSLAFAGGASAQQKADVTSFDIDNVRLGMTADQAISALRQTYGEAVEDWQVADHSLTEPQQLKRDVRFGQGMIFHSLDSRDAYTNHIFYSFKTKYDGLEMLVINLAKAPGQEAGPARVYQVLDINGMGIRGPVIDDITEHALTKYGAPTYGASAVAEIWCTEASDHQCAEDKPYLALVPVRKTFQQVRSMMQLYDPAYGIAASKAVNAVY